MNTINRFPSGLQNNPKAGSRQSHELPLNIIILIIDFIRDTPTLAAVTRTSKLLYYMTVPRLYETVILRSFPSIRFFDGLPEGYGYGSPFSMALSGLVTKNFTIYVKSWTLCGEWKEDGVEEFRSGRVPDSVLMLNTVIRAAMDRMDNIHTFQWELNTKPLMSVYAGLSLRKTLTSLTVQFPSARTPRPTVLIPPIPNLKSFRALSIDPLCYPDDISLLLLGSKKLTFLTLEWSPRMRREGEPSIQLGAYFGRCISAGHKLPLQRLSFKNMYAPNDQQFEQAFRPDTLHTVDFINCANLWDPTTAFVDETWRFKHNRPRPDNLKSMRSDAVDKGHVEFLSGLHGLEEILMVSPLRKINEPSPGGRSGTASSNGGLDSPSPYQSDQITVSLASDYLAAICKQHGSTLRVLLLSEHFALSLKALAHLVDSCPKLEQVAVTVDENDFATLRSILASAPHLIAFRILVAKETDFYTALKKFPDSSHGLPLSLELWREPYKNLKWFGLGDIVFRLGKNIKIGENWRRSVTTASWEDVKDIAIWGKDSLDV